MTSLPAARLKLKDRGTIAVGMKADLMLFDPATIIDRSTFEHPRLRAARYLPRVRQRTAGVDRGFSRKRAARRVACVRLRSIESRELRRSSAVAQRVLLGRAKAGPQRCRMRACVTSSQLLALTVIHYGTDVGPGARACRATRGAAAAGRRVPPSTPR